MNNVQYNIFSKDISNGIDGEEIGLSNDYLIVLDAPASAEIYVKLDSTINDKIPLKKSWELDATGVNKIYLYCNAIPGEKITFGQAPTRDDFRVSTSPILNDIEEIQTIKEVQTIKDIGSNAVELDKLINPHNISTSLFGGTSSTSTVTYIDKVLTCDKIVINLTVSHNNLLGYRYGHELIAQLDGVPIACNSHYHTSGGEYLAAGLENKIVLNNIKNKRLKVLGKGSHTEFNFGIVLQEYTKK